MQGRKEDGAAVGHVCRHKLGSVTLAAIPAYFHETLSV